MTPSPALFQLIKSLSKQEKIYFKRLSGKKTAGEKKNYLRLFDALDKQTVYDEPKIKKAIPDKNFIKQLPVLKKYLYNRILECLVSFDNSVDAYIKSSLLRIQILHDRGLPEQCEKILAKIRQRSVELEKHVYLLEILEWERKLLYAKSDFKNLEKTYRSRFHEVLDTTEKINNIEKYRFILDGSSIFDSRSGTTIRNKTTRKKLEKTLHTPLVKNENAALSQKAKMLRLTIKSTSYWQQGNLNDSYTYGKALEALVSSSEIFRTGEPVMYLSILSNLLVYQMDLNKETEFTKTLEKIRAYPTNSIRIKERIFRTYIMETFFYIQRGFFEKGLAVIPSIEKGYKYFEKNMNKIAEVCLFDNIAQTYFGTGDFHKSLYWINKIINHTPPSLRTDIQSSVRIMNLVVHYELDNMEYLEYAIQPTNQYLHKINSAFKFENLVIDFFKELKGTNQQQRVKLFKNIREKLIQLVKNPVERQSLENFDSISWLTSKIEGRLFADVVREKAEQSVKKEHLRHTTSK